MKPGLIRFSQTGLLLLLVSFNAGASTDLLNEFTRSGQVGAGKLTWWGLTVYDATLFAPDGEYRPEQPHALKITYAFSFSSEELARRSLQEIEAIHGDQPDPEAVVRQLQAVFPDVDSGDSIVGLHQPGEGAKFYSNGVFFGSIDDAGLARDFFSIWLDPRTSEPGLRARLIGEDR